MKDLISKLRRIDTGIIIGFLVFGAAVLVASLVATVGGDLSILAFTALIVSAVILFVIMAEFFKPINDDEIDAITIVLGVIGGIAWSFCSLFLILK